MASGFGRYTVRIDGQEIGDATRVETSVDYSEFGPGRTMYVDIETDHKSVIKAMNSSTSFAIAARNLMAHPYKPEEAHDGHH